MNRDNINEFPDQVTSSLSSPNTFAEAGFVTAPFVAFLGKIKPYLNKTKTYFTD